MTRKEQKAIKEIQSLVDKYDNKENEVDQDLLNSIKVILNIIDNQNKIIDENKVLKLIYTNLRNQYNKIILEILGDNYYNLGTDTYNCDIITANDIIVEYKKALGKIRLYFKKKQYYKK